MACIPAQLYHATDSSRIDINSFCTDFQGFKADPQALFFVKAAIYMCVINHMPEMPQPIDYLKVFSYADDRKA